MSGEMKEVECHLKEDAQIIVKWINARDRKFRIRNSKQKSLEEITFDADEHKDDKERH